jgi:hypothetical protein
MQCVTVSRLLALHYAVRDSLSFACIGLAVSRLLALHYAVRDRLECIVQYVTVSRLLSDSNLSRRSVHKRLSLHVL